MNLDQLKKRQAWDLEMKIMFTKKKIIDFYQHYDGKVYIAFSGGKDSTVLLHIARSIYPDIDAVFSDTGLEYPEIREFVNTFDNVTIVKPKMSFFEVIKTYGYPAVSKQQARYISDLQNPTPNNKKTRDLRLGLIPNRSKMSQLSKKWIPLVDSGYKFSGKCCDIMKKNPLKEYHKKTKQMPIIGTMAEDSSQRKMSYIKTGCNSFSTGMSTPMGFWKEEDVWDYIKTFNVPYCKIYDTGVKRTGCIFCMFGVHLEKRPNRFDLLEKTHPQLHKYCMETLGLKNILDLVLKK